jgi:hypothetical protein
MQVNENVARSNSLFTRILRRTYQYRAPRTWATIRVLRGMWLIFLGGILAANSYPWGWLLMVIGVLSFAEAKFIYAWVTSTN